MSLIGAYDGLNMYKALGLICDFMPFFRGFRPLKMHLAHFLKSNKLIMIKIDRRQGNGFYLI